MVPFLTRQSLSPTTDPSPVFRIIAFEVEPFCLVWSEMKASRGPDRRVRAPRHSNVLIKAKTRPSEVNTRLICLPSLDRVNRPRHFSASFQKHFRWIPLFFPANTAGWNPIIKTPLLSQYWRLRYTYLFTRAKQTLCEILKLGIRGSDGYCCVTVEMMSWSA